MASGGARASEGSPPSPALLERLRAAAHAAVDAGDSGAAVTITRLLEEREPPPAAVVSLDAARGRTRPARRREQRGR